MIILFHRCRDASTMQLSTALNQNSWKIIITPTIFLYPHFTLRKGKKQCWNGIYLSHHWLESETAILLRLTSKHCSSATCMQVCNYCHNSRMQSIFTQPPLLSTSVLMEIHIKVMKMSHPFSEFSLHNHMLINDRYPQHFLLCPLCSFENTE